MPVGVIINVLSVFIGGIIGSIAGKHLPQKLKDNLQLIFSVCAMGMGVTSVVLMVNMPAVIFSVITGTAIGTLLHLGDLINKGAEFMQKPISRIFGPPKDMQRDQFMYMLVTIIVLFCASATGIYGSIDSGMTGDHTILLAKSILDIFTALIFACNLGMVVSVIAIPQAVIFLTLFFAAKLIFPLTTPDMINDFKACGGFLLLATAFRMMKVKEFPIADMIPAMIIVMPISWAWTNIIIPLL